jgi:flagellar FliL protein
VAQEAPTDTAAPQKGGRRRLFIIAGAAVLLLAGAAGGAAFFLKLPPFAHHAPAEHAEPRPAPPVLVDIPEIVTNLNVSGRRPVFVRLRAKAETAKPADAAAVQAAMPRLLDMFTTFLRETRPEELRGSAGTHRLREELLARANIATQPGVVTGLLLVEVTVQ